MKIIIVGGGAAGMMAACVAAANGNEVVLLEKNEKLGKKLFITGKGRCNLTNACDTEGLFSNVINNPKFLYSAFYGFSNYQVMEFFEKLGVRLKTERGMRVFPESDHSSDIIKALEKELKKNNVTVNLNTSIRDILHSETRINGIVTNKNDVIVGDVYILAMGGKSYQACGTTGDFERILPKMNISLKNLEPSLVPFETKETYVSKLMGLSLKNVRGTLSRNGKILYEEMGEMLFTHFGISGPLVLSASCYVKEDMYKDDLQFSIDLKPALSVEQLDARVLKDFKDNNQKQFRNSLTKLLPKKLIPVIIEITGIDENKRVCDITKEERKALINALKCMTLHISGNRGFNEAIITRGGISVKEVDPSTMRVKKYENLYACGEMLDLDAFTGGFNLQIAWSTGYLAGESCSQN